MKKAKFYIKYTSAYMLWAFLSFGLTANATHSDAVADIMNDQRFTGAISSIEWLTSRVDHWFTVVITATAFFIISSAMLKNVCAGAYCANPKFWDKVDEAHKQKEGVAFMSYITGMKDTMQNLSAGGIRDAILSIVPNMKAWTDFDDATIEPKAYFTKAIPQMLLCIIIGVFIYNGYYRDTASTVGSFGSEICNRVFSSVDAGSFVDKLSQTTGTPDNIFSSDQSIAGQIEYKFSSELYKVYLSAAKGENSSTFKTSLMRDCEDAAQKMFNANLSSSGGDAALGAQYNIDSENRTYDYTISGLKITATPYSEAIANQTFTIDSNEDNSELYVKGVGAAPATISSYLTDATENAYYYFTFTLKGSKSQGTTSGASSITASAGSWNGAASSAINVTYTVNNWSTSSDGKTSLCNDDMFTVIVTETELMNHINGEAESGTTYTFEEVVWSGYDGYDANSNPKVKVAGKASGSVIDKLKAKVTVKDSEGQKTAFTIPVSITIQ